MSAAYWRRKSRESIAEALASVGPQADEPTRRRAISAAYPFGPRRMYPYRIWLEEVGWALNGTPAAAAAAKQAALLARVGKLKFGVPLEDQLRAAGGEE